MRCNMRKTAKLLTILTYTAGNAYGNICDFDTNAQVYADKNSRIIKKCYLPDVNIDEYNTRYDLLSEFSLIEACG